MTCEQAEMLLAQLVYDEFDDESVKGDLLAHLEQCPACSEKLADMRMTAKLLGEAVMTGAEPRLGAQRRATLLAELMREDQPLAARREVLSWLSADRPRVTAAAAAIVLLISGLMVMLLMPALGGARHAARRMNDGTAPEQPPYASGHLWQRAPADADEEGEADRPTDADSLPPLGEINGTDVVRREDRDKQLAFADRTKWGLRGEADRSYWQPEGPWSGGIGWSDGHAKWRDGRQAKAAWEDSSENIFKPGATQHRWQSDTPVNGAPERDSLALAGKDGKRGLGDVADKWGGNGGDVSSARDRRSLNAPTEEAGDAAEADAPTATPSPPHDTDDQSLAMLGYRGPELMPDEIDFTYQSENTRTKREAETAPEKRASGNGRADEGKAHEHRLLTEIDRLKQQTEALNRPGRHREAEVVAGQTLALTDRGRSVINDEDYVSELRAAETDLNRKKVELGVKARESEREGKVAQPDVSSAPAFVSDLEPAPEQPAFDPDTAATYESRIERSGDGKDLRERVDRLLGRANELRAEQRYEHAIELLNQAQFLEPHNVAIKAFIDTLEDSRLSVEHRKNIEERSKQTLREGIDNADATVPWTELMTYPSDWPELTQRRLAALGGDDTDGDTGELNKALEPQDELRQIGGLPFPGGNGSVSTTFGIVLNEGGNQSPARDTTTTAFNAMALEKQIPNDSFESAVTLTDSGAAAVINGNAAPSSLPGSLSGTGGALDISGQVTLDYATKPQVVYDLPTSQAEVQPQAGQRQQQAQGRQSGQQGGQQSQGGSGAEGGRGLEAERLAKEVVNKLATLSPDARKRVLDAYRTAQAEEIASQPPALRRMIMEDDPGLAAFVPTFTLDGEVTQVRELEGRKFVQINLGENDRVREGTKFVVFRNGDELVGEMVVHRVDETNAAGMMTLTKGNVVTGDRVRTGPMFSDAHESEPLAKALADEVAKLPPDVQKLVLDTYRGDGQARAPEATKELIAQYFERLDGDTPETKNVRVYRLAHADAQAIAESVSDLVADGIVQPDADSNSLVIAGTAEQLERVAGRIRELDMAAGDRVEDEGRATSEDEAGEEEETESPGAPATVAVNPWVATEADRFSTFALESDTASFTQARRAILQDRQLPPAHTVRMEEFVNAFDYNYPRAAKGVFNVHAKAAPMPFGESGNVLLQVGVQAKVIGREGRKPANLVLLVDTSGSMARPDRLPVVQDALRTLVHHMEPDDRVTLVTFNTKASLVLQHAAGTQRDTIRNAIDGITTRGSTNLLEGMRIAYQLAHDGYQTGAINRIILCTDGVANVGEQQAGQVLERVAAFRRQGVTLTTVGVGAGAYNDEMLEQLSNRGDGQYVYIDSPEEARRIFAEQVASTLQTVAGDAKLQVEFNPDRVRRYRLVGYENRDIRDEDFRNDAIDAGEIGSGQAATALYELEMNHGVKRGDLGTVFVRYRNVETGGIEEIATRLGESIVRDRRPETDPYFFLAASAGRMAELLRESPHARGANYADVEAVMRRVAQQLTFDERVDALLRMSQRAEGLPRASK